jgi:hypothetical protein
VNYGKIAEVLGQLVSAGFRHLALISDSAAPTNAPGSAPADKPADQSDAAKTQPPQ